MKTNFRGTETKETHFSKSNNEIKHGETCQAQDS